MQASLAFPAGREACNRTSDRGEPSRDDTGASNGWGQGITGDGEEDSGSRRGRWTMLNDSKQNITKPEYEDEGFPQVSRSP